MMDLCILMFYLRIYCSIGLYDMMNSVRSGSLRAQAVSTDTILAT